jgi:hypothetical protein
MGRIDKYLKSPLYSRGLCLTASLFRFWGYNTYTLIDAVKIGILIKV